MPVLRMADVAVADEESENCLAILPGDWCFSSCLLPRTMSSVTTGETGILDGGVRFLMESLVQACSTTTGSIHDSVTSSMSSNTAKLCVGSGQMVLVD